MVLLYLIGNIIIVTLYIAFFIIFTKYSKDIFFILYFSISVLLLNTSSLLKYISFKIITSLF